MAPTSGIISDQRQVGAFTLDPSVHCSGQKAQHSLPQPGASPPRLDAIAAGMEILMENGKQRRRAAGRVELETW